MEITLEEIQKRFEELPEDLQWAIMGANVDDNVIEIGKETGLNVEQMGQLSLETNMVMFGIVHTDKFEESLKASLGLPDEKIRIIVNLVNEKILKNIREKLMALQGVKREEESKKDHDIFSGAGIEIAPEEISAPKKEDRMEEQSEILSRVENPSLIKKAEIKIPPPIAEQKFSGSFQIPSIKTDHTLPSLSKDKTAPATPVPPSDKPKIDPYREIPE